MCGIVGLISSAGDAPNLLKRGIDSLMHRGPDGEGTFHLGNVHLGHRRLKIIDLSESGKQPFYSKDGRYVLVFNGEIFNYKELRFKLENEGVFFNTATDTEVLLELLIKYGLDVLDELNGFWAFSFYDTEKQNMILCRDRLGVKPLFYSSKYNRFGFASEPKALFQMGFEKSIDESHLDEQLFYRYVSGGNTIFKDVNRIKPGHYVIFNVCDYTYEEYRWYHLGEKSKIKFGINGSPNEWFEKQFIDAVSSRMVSDVPVGTLLSGGLDSSSVLLAQKFLGKTENLSTWNISFSDKIHDESDLARQFSTSVGASFNSFEFNGDELFDLTVDAIKFHDEPLVHTQEPHILGLCRKAKNEVTVLLSGEASDELLGGYVRYKVHDQALRYSLLRFIPRIPFRYLNSSRLKKIWKYLEVDNQAFQLMTNSNNIFLSDLEKHNVHGFDVLPKYRVEILKEAEFYFPNSRLRQLMYMDHHTYIPSLNDRNDRMSMGAGIECREPFEDKDLIEGVWGLDDAWFNTKGKGKYLLMQTFGKKLPHNIQNHRKIGLSVPWADIIMNNEKFQERLKTMVDSPIFKMGRMWQFDIAKLVSEFRKGGREDVSLFLQLYFLHFWYDVQFGKEK
jgi:asparagine synthase (glutamine-hydrolysing)